MHTDMKMKCRTALEVLDIFIHFHGHVSCSLGNRGDITRQTRQISMDCKIPNSTNIWMLYKSYQVCSRRLQLSKHQVRTCKISRFSGSLFVFVDTYEYTLFTAVSTQYTSVQFFIPLDFPWPWRRKKLADVSINIKSIYMEILRTYGMKNYSRTNYLWVCWCADVVAQKKRFDVEDKSMLVTSYSRVFHHEPRATALCLRHDYRCHMVIAKGIHHATYSLCSQLHTYTSHNTSTLLSLTHLCGIGWRLPRSGRLWHP